MLLELVRVVLGRGECKARCDDTLDCRIVCQVEEERDTVQTTVLFEVLFEEASRLHVHTHRGEHDGEVVFVAVMHILSRTLDKTRLPHDLRGNLDAAQINTLGPR